MPPCLPTVTTENSKITGTIASTEKSSAEVTSIQIQQEAALPSRSGRKKSPFCSLPEPTPVRICTSWSSLRRPRRIHDAFLHSKMTCMRYVIKRCPRPYIVLKRPKTSTNIVLITLVLSAFPRSTRTSCYAYLYLYCLTLVFFSFPSLRFCSELGRACAYRLEEPCVCPPSLETRCLLLHMMDQRSFYFLVNHLFEVCST